MRRKPPISTVRYQRRGNPRRERAGEAAVLETRTKPCLLSGAHRSGIPVSFHFCFLWVWSRKVGFSGQVLPWEGPTAWQPPKDPSPWGRQGADLGSDRGACGGSMHFRLAFSAKLNCTALHFPMRNGRSMHQISSSKGFTFPQITHICFLPKPLAFWVENTHV